MNMVGSAVSPFAFGSARLFPGLPHAARALRCQTAPGVAGGRFLRAPHTPARFITRMARTATSQCLLPRLFLARAASRGGLTTPACLTFAAAPSPSARFGLLRELPACLPRALRFAPGTFSVRTPFAAVPHWLPPPTMTVLLPRTVRRARLGFCSAYYYSIPFHYSTFIDLT